MESGKLKYKELVGQLTVDTRWSRASLSSSIAATMGSQACGALSATPITPLRRSWQKQHRNWLPEKIKL